MLITFWLNLALILLLNRSLLFLLLFFSVEGTLFIFTAAADCDDGRDYDYDYTYSEHDHCIVNCLSHALLIAAVPFG